MPIDTHQVFKHLKRDNVFTEEQADRLADALSEMDVASATKEDLEATEKRLTNRIEEVENQLGSRVDRVASSVNEVENRLNGRIDEVENRLTQRIELSEERLGQRISDLRSDLYRALLIGFGAVAALVTVLNYVIG